MTTIPTENRTSGQTSILVVEDEESISTFLKHVLEREQFDVTVVDTGEQALETADRIDPDVILLDFELPGISGQDVCRTLRSTTDAYIVMLTGRRDEVDKVLSLSLGADDYVVKPFSHRELIARIYTLLRRPRTRTASVDALRALGPLKIDLSARTVRINDDEIDLTRTEFDLIDVLTTDPSAVVSRTDLLKRVWNTDWDGGDHLIDAHVHNLRKKLAARGVTTCIRTVRGVGYRFVSDD